MPMALSPLFQSLYIKGQRHWTVVATKDVVMYPCRASGQTLRNSRCASLRFSRVP